VLFFEIINFTEAESTYLQENRIVFYHKTNLKIKNYTFDK